MRAKAIRPTLPPAPPGAASALMMLLDKRVLHVHPTHDSWEPVEMPSFEEQVPFVVIVPYYQRPDLLQQTLRSLTMVTYDKWALHVVACSAAAKAEAQTAMLAVKDKLPPIAGVSGPNEGCQWDIFEMLCYAHSSMRPESQGSLTFKQRYGNPEYTVKVDADDLIHPSALSILSNALKKSPVDLLCAPQFRMADDLLVRPALDTHEDVTLKAIWSGEAFPYSSMMVWSRAMFGSLIYPSPDWIKRVHGDNTLPFLFDPLFTYEVLGGGGTVGHTNAVVYFKRTHSKSAMARYAQVVKRATGGTLSIEKLRLALIKEYWLEQYFEHVTGDITEDPDSGLSADG